MQVPVWEPPIAGSEIEHVVGMLERLRMTFRWKADGLDAEQLRARIPSSALSIGALLKHLAVCEDVQFGWKSLGEPPETWVGIPEGIDPGAWQFTVYDNESAELLYAFWDDAVARSRTRLERMLADGGLDRPGSFEFPDGHPSLRRWVCDLIEEYGRHTGHTDLIRESIDGLVGEDPPVEWVPPHQR